MERLEETRSEPKRPADFVEFWRHTREHLAETPVEWERVPDEAATSAALTVDWLKFPSLHGRPIYGWLAVPKHHRPAGNAGYLWLPGYSLGNPPPGPESLYSGTVTLGLNLHGNLPDTPYNHPAAQNQDYITQGIESPETYIYRDIVCHCLRALEVLAAQPEVGPDKLIVGGMSQGGGLALVTAALAPDAVRLCLADMPWLCDLDRALSLIDRSRYTGGRRIPDGRALVEDYANARPALREQIFQTYRYFDPLSHAADIRCPTQVSAGGRDPSCRPPTIFAVYNAITAPKEMLYLPDTGHEIVPAMHQAHQKWVQQGLENTLMNEEQVGVVSKDTTEITTSGESVTGKRLFTDGGNGNEREVIERDPVAGASSPAPASSGIPSAMKQQGIASGETIDQTAPTQSETPMGDRKIAHHQDLKP